MRYLWLVPGAAVLTMSAGCADSGVPSSGFEVCGGRVSVRPDYRVIDRVREDGIVLYYVAPVDPATAAPADMATLFEPDDTTTQLLERPEQLGPESFDLGRIVAATPGCSGIVGVDVGEAVRLVLTDVEGEGPIDWIVSVNIGQDR